MTGTIPSSFLALGTCLAAMRFLVAAFLLLALGASALAEPVHFKDCGEPQPARDSRALSGTPRRDPPRLGWAGPADRQAQLLEWAGVGEKLRAAKPNGRQLCLFPETRGWGP